MFALDSIDVRVSSDINSTQTHTFARLAVRVTVVKMLKPRQEPRQNIKLDLLQFLIPVMGTNHL